MTRRLIEHCLHECPGMRRAVKPGIIARKMRQHGKEREYVDIVLGGFVLLAVPKEISAGRNVGIVARCGLNESSGSKSPVKVLRNPRTGVQLRKRYSRPGHISHCAALEERKPGSDERAARVGNSCHVGLS